MLLSNASFPEKVVAHAYSWVQRASCIMSEFGVSCAQNYNEQLFENGSIFSILELFSSSWHRNSWTHETLIIDSYHDFLSESNS